MCNLVKFNDINCVIYFNFRKSISLKLIKICDFSARVFVVSHNKCTYKKRCRRKKSRIASQVMLYKQSYKDKNFICQFSCWFVFVHVNVCILLILLESSKYLLIKNAYNSKRLLFKFFFSYKWITHLLQRVFNSYKI